MPRVLVIEDESRVLRSLVEGLRAAGFEVKAAARGDDGSRLAASEPFDCIILDWMLPGRDGLQVLCRPAPGRADHAGPAADGSGRHR